MWFNIYKNILKRLKQLQKAKEWYEKYENFSRIEIIVDKNVYDKATHLANRLNTNIEGIIALAAHNIIKKETRPFMRFVDYKHDIKKYLQH